MDGLRGGYYAKRNKSKKDKFQMISLICATYITKLMIKSERDSDVENGLMFARWDGC